MKKSLLILTSLAIGIASVGAQTTSDFENLTLAAGTYWTGTDASADSTFDSGNAGFQNSFSSWWSAGWAYSNVKDSTTAGYTNNYGARAGSGYSESANYVVGKSGAKVVLKGESGGRQVEGMYINNGTYAALSMTDGDGFAKKFGGATGNDEDWFLLTIKGHYNGSVVSDSVNFYLADFRFADSAQDYVVKDWRWVDLTSLGNVDSLTFSLNSTDIGDWGMNTPAYFCMDNLKTAGTPLFVSKKSSSVIEVYPNPTYGVLNVNGVLVGDNVQIIDVMGKVVMGTTGTSNLSTFDVGNLESGIYILNVWSHDELTQKKFIKK
ncbi:MAG: hypothetical protein ACJAZ2_001891 [Glaciecola sp.]|jgi:hypothetical protein